MKISLVFLLLFLHFPAYASAQDGWRDMNGKAIPETASTKSKDGFNVFLVVTPDTDWQQKWNTPPETVPNFTEAKEVTSGGELFVLAFLSNPKVDATGMTDVTCDFLVIRPDASKSVEEIDMPCFKEKLTTNPKNVYLSAASLKFVSEPTDLHGTWIVRITLKDNLRHVEIPLETSFLVK